jgi:LPS export ABC transporter permease LptF/LPS export ABC transporter permease LptG
MSAVPDLWYKMGGMFKFFDRYVLREIVPPFLVGLLLYSFVLLMNQILVLAEMFITKGVSLGLAVRILLLLVPSLLAFAVPMAVLMGILAGLGRLSTDSEITAFKTLGISSGRLARPLFLFAFAGWLLTSSLTLFLAPWANFKWVQAITGSVMAKVQFQINPREFYETIPGMVIFVQDIEDGKNWKNVFIYVKTNPEEPRLILAREGRLNLFPETKTAVLELRNGTVHSYPRSDPEKYSVTSFERLEEGVDVQGLFPEITSEKRVREKDIMELREGAKALELEMAALRRNNPAVAARAAGADAVREPTIPERDLRDITRDYRAHWVEIHKKFALPFVCFIFVLLGLPLGMTTRKGGRTSGFTISIAVILFYYVLITAGEKMAMDGRISPFLGMWGPNIILSLVGVILFVKTLREAPLFAWLSMFRGWGRKIAAGRKRREDRRLPTLAPRFPNILDRYIIRKFVFIFALIFSALISISIIVTFFERIDNVYAHDKSLSLFFGYIWSRVPEFASVILPVAALTATLLTLGILMKFNEVTAMKACGISVYRIFLPVLFMSLLVSLFSFYLQERVLPSSNNRAGEIWNRINDLPARSYSYLNRHWLLSRTKNRIYQYDFFDPGPSAFSRLSIFDIDPETWTIRRRIFCEKAFLTGEELRLVDGWARSFPRDLPVSFEERPEMSLSSVEPKSYFLQEWKEPSQMTYPELRGYLSEIREMGFDATRFEVDMNAKISFPFVSLIMTLLGIPFAFSMGKKGTLVGIGLSIVIAMVYWGAIGVSRSLGYVHFMAPFLAAWAPNLIFGLIGTYLVFRLRT